MKDFVLKKNVFHSSMNIQNRKCMKNSKTHDNRNLTRNFKKS